MRTAPLARGAWAIVSALALTLAATPAHAIKIATYNMMGYENPGEGPGLPSPYITSRQANFRTVMAALDPDLLMAEECNSAAAADSFRLDVLENVAPGVWSSVWANVGGGEGMGIFYKTAKFGISNVIAIGDGGPRNALLAVVKPTGYTKNGAWFRLYGIHFKAGSASTDISARASEAASLRTTINGTNTSNVGLNFILLGDSNIYDGTEGAYLRLTESQTNNAGRSFDYLSLSAPWHQNSANAAVYTQCPCNSCTVTGQSGGGLDDRFDLVLTSSTLRDGTGLDYVPGSYVPFGNDGQHYNTDINGGGFNLAVGISIANALHDAADHIPAMITLQLPPKYGVASALAIGPTIVGGTTTAPFAVSNAAPAPAQVLTYTLSASAGFSAPGGSFDAAAGAGANVHTIGMTGASVGDMTGTLTLASNDNDTTSKAIALAGRVIGHAAPSLDSLVVTASGLVDFGSHDAGLGRFPDQAVRVFNPGYGAYQAQLAVTGANITGDPRFSIAGGFTPATLGAVGQTWNVHFDDSSVPAADSVYTATLTFTTSDENLPGATALAPLTVTLQARVLDGTEGVGEQRLALAFLPPRPNPTHGATEFGYELPRAAHVSLGIYDPSGRRVATLLDGPVGEGHHSVRWNTRTDAGIAAPAGLYFVRFDTDGLHQTSRLVVLP